MKRTLFFALSLLPLTMFGQLTDSQGNQLKRHEFSLGYSPLTSFMYMVENGGERIIGNELTHYLPEEGMRRGDPRCRMCGLLSAEYLFNVSPQWSFGASVIWEGVNVKRTDARDDGTTYNASYGTNYALFMATARLAYLHKPNLILYSKVQLGGGVGRDYRRGLYESDEMKGWRNGKESYSLFVSNLTVFGVRFGGSVFGMAETCIGWDALFKAGIGYKF